MKQTREYIKQKVFSEPITANALKEQRAKFSYDSWINVYERYGTEKENILANLILLSPVKLKLPFYLY